MLDGSTVNQGHYVPTHIAQPSHVDSAQRVLFDVVCTSHVWRDGELQTHCTKDALSSRAM